MQELDDMTGMQAFADTAERGAGESLSAWQYRVAVLQHHRRVFRVARALLRDAAEAEDVTQETFMRYWQQGAAVERPREWLMKVARNACLDRLRKSGRLVSGDDADEVVGPDHDDPAWHYERQALAARLERAIDALTEPQRSLIVLFDIHGMSGAECAQIVGISVNQVKVYLHRARRRLRLELEES